MRKSIAYKSNNEILDDLKGLQSVTGGPLLDFERMEEVKIPLRANPKLEPGLFYPDPFIPHGWMAHPTTLKAIRKDLFILQENDLSEIYSCEGCGRQLDLQYWYFCPYCESPFRV